MAPHRTRNKPQKRAEWRFSQQARRSRFFERIARSEIDQAYQYDKARLEGKHRAIGRKLIAAIPIRGKKKLDHKTTDRLRQKGSPHGAHIEYREPASDLVGGAQRFGVANRQRTKGGHKPEYGT